MIGVASSRSEAAEAVSRNLDGFEEAKDLCVSRNLDELCKLALGSTAQKARSVQKSGHRELHLTLADSWG